MQLEPAMDRDSKRRNGAEGVCALEAVLSYGLASRIG
jgi:hypothetical protein